MSSTKHPNSSFFAALPKKARLSPQAIQAEGKATQSTVATSSSTKNTILFCDLDGVLVDFEAGVQKCLKKPLSQVPSHRLWAAIHGTRHFFRNLPWTHDGKELWTTLLAENKPLHILTGVSTHKDVVQDKWEWCKRELGVDTVLVDKTGSKASHVLNARPPAYSGAPAADLNQFGIVQVITCWSKNKHCESKRGHVLIDDRDKLREAWERAGGTFVLHISTAQTLAQLRQLGLVAQNRTDRRGVDECHDIDRETQKFVDSKRENCHNT